MKDFFKTHFLTKRAINYPYFILFFVSISTLTLLFSDIPTFFTLYGILQAFFEVSLIACISYMFQSLAPRFIFLLFLCLSFTSLLLHFANFKLVRLMDVPINYLFKFLFGSGVDHFFAGLQALNLNWTMIILGAMLCILIPVAGLGLYWLGDRLAKKRPLFLSPLQMGTFALVAAIGLFAFEICSISLFHQHLHERYKKALPLGTTFLSPPSNQLALTKSLPIYPSEKTCRKKIPKLALSHKPNIYFFVIETLRKDFLTAAPALTAFGDQNIQFESSFANANATYLSWFALFHSNLPLYWTQVRDTWKNGSIPLQYLKKMGYKIHVYSSADLRYFGMDKLLFGNQRQIADKIEEYSCDHSIEPCDRDALAMKAIEENLAPSGHAYFIFLDSTHSEYSIPKDFPLRFEPSALGIDYLTLGPNSPELELIKNRYRNAISYVDTLMDRFFTLLKEKNLYNQSIIAITGDHGEEFFEEGALFHGTHLNSYQTSVPILMKFPSRDWTPQVTKATHIDIFPSILHYLTKQSDFGPLFQGRSIFNFDTARSRMAVLQNGPQPPCEFALHGDDFELHGRFLDASCVEIIQLQGSIEPDIFESLLVE